MLLYTGQECTAEMNMVRKIHHYVKQLNKDSLKMVKVKSQTVMQDQTE